jgi:endo-1,4-beta-mannosidase
MKTIVLNIFICLFVSSCLDESMTVENNTKPKIGRIGIRINSIGKQEFYDKGNNEKFVPKGYNYTHVGEFTWNGIQITNHITFKPDYYNSDASNSLLIKLKNENYNTVRIFINPLLVANANGDLNTSYVAAIVDFLIKAEKHGIGVIITTDMIPLTAYGTVLQSEDDIWWWNKQYVFNCEIELEKNFWQSLIVQLKNANVSLQTILAYEIRNEFFYHPSHAPFNSSSGIVHHPNGIDYNMAIATDKEALMQASFVYWSTNVRNNIKEVDAEALVAVGFYGPEPLGKPSVLAIQNSELDFVDLHMYPEQHSLSEYIDYFEISQNTEKLIILGEFGIVEDQTINIDVAKNQLLNWRNDCVNSYGIDGWLLWTWDTDSGSKLSISDSNDVLFKAFSPMNN